MTKIAFDLMLLLLLLSSLSLLSLSVPVPVPLMLLMFFFGVPERRRRWCSIVESAVARPGARRPARTLAVEWKIVETRKRVREMGRFA